MNSNISFLYLVIPGKTPILIQVYVCSIAIVAEILFFTAHQQHPWLALTEPLGFADPQLKTTAPKRNNFNYLSDIILLTLL